VLNLNFCKNLLKQCEEEYFKRYSESNLIEEDKKLDDTHKGQNTKSFNNIRIKSVVSASKMFYNLKLKPKLKQSAKLGSVKSVVILRLKTIDLSTKASDVQEIRRMHTQSYVTSMIEIVNEVMK